MRVTAEPEVVAWVLHTALGSKRPLPPPDQWTQAIHALGASRLTPLAVHQLGDRITQLPRDARVAMESAMLRAEVMTEQRQKQLAHAIPVLESTGLPWLILKGWPLALRLYPRPNCRPSGDLDLLVSPRHLAPVREVLDGIGYRAEETGTTGYHWRLVRQCAGAEPDVIELHYGAGPPTMVSPSADVILRSRRPLETAAGVIWIPSVEMERDLLILHYLRHGGFQAILLLDVLLQLEGKPFRHPMGRLVGDDLERLGFRRTIDGPRSLRQALLARWMSARTFEQRRVAQHTSILGLPLALGRFPIGTFAELARLIWPRHPTPRWRAEAATPAGRYTWRWKRLARLGR